MPGNTVPPSQVDAPRTGACQRSNLSIGSHGQDLISSDSQSLSDGAYVRVDFMVVHRHDLSVIENGIRRLLSPEGTLPGPDGTHYYPNPQNPMT